MSIYPCLTYRDVRAAMAWLDSVFEIKGRALVHDGASADDRVDHAILSSGDGKILVESERPNRSGSGGNKEDRTAISGRSNPPSIIRRATAPPDDAFGYVPIAG